MKTWFKLSFTTLLIGWFVFMWLCLYGITQTVEVRLAIFIFGLFSCIVGSFSFQGLLVNKSFWMKQEELEDYIQQHKESIKEYNEAKRKLEEHVLTSNKQV